MVSRVLLDTVVGGTLSPPDGPLDRDSRVLSPPASVRPCLTSNLVPSVPVIECMHATCHANSNAMPPRPCLTHYATCRKAAGSRPDEVNYSF
jgi:hypothetical protein